jgi:transcriptional regulator with XRE-family HTH domain
MSKRKKTFTNYEINKNIAKILVLHRVWSGLNQTKVAKDLNVSFQQVQKYEKCMNRISAEMLIDICKKRKWDITLFMNNKPESILDEWIDNDIDKGFHYPLKANQITRKWKEIDRVGEDNYYRKHHFTKYV